LARAGSLELVIGATIETSDALVGQAQGVLLQPVHRARGAGRGRDRRQQADHLEQHGVKLSDMSNTAN
jgi:hypothetical protein